MKSLIQKIVILFYIVYYRYILKFKSRIDLQKYQLKKLRKLLNFVGHNSPFYQQLLQKVKINQLSLSNAPIINKKVMVENFDTITTTELKRDKIFDIVIEGEKKREFTASLSDHVIGLSSGTTGSRGLYIVSPSEQARHAGYLLAKHIPSFFKKNRIAYFQRNDSNLYSKGKSKWLQFKFFDLFYPLQDHVETLNIYNPTLLVGPGSVLKRLALLKEKGLLKIQPEKIINSVEVLDPLDEIIIKKAFDKDIIHQVYICTEGFIGTTCQKGKIHLNEDLVYIEKKYIQDNVFTPIITDLNRFSQPHIRYELNDLLVEDTHPCECGANTTVIHKILGRQDDICYLRNKNSPNKLMEVFPDFMQRPILYTGHLINDYFVTQIDPENLKINLNLQGDYSKNEIEKQLTDLYIQQFEAMGHIAPNIVFKYDVIDLKLNKARRVKSEYVNEQH